jgi:hypothetical protein
MSYAADARRSNHAPATRKTDEPVFLRFKILIVAVIFLQRIGLNLFIGGKAFPFPVSLFITPVIVMWNLLSGASKFSMRRFGLYALFLAIMTSSTLLNNGGDSTMSLFLVAGIYAMFLFPVQLDQAAYMRFFRMIANVASVIATLGILQYVIQFVWQPDWLFTWRHIVPQNFLIEFNTLNVTRYGSDIYKANGFFLMEASYLSQLAARVLLISIFILKDFRYTIPLGFGLVTAYSGTGMILFAIFGLLPMMFIFMRHSRFRLFLPIALLISPIALLLVWSQLDLGLFVERLNEFSNPRSSGYARFVTSQIMLDLFSRSDLLQLLFGSGPGASDRYSASVHAVGETFASTWIKLILDYGMLGFAAFLAFFFTCVRHTLRSTWLATAFTFHFFLLDGGFAVPQQAFLTLLLGAFVCLKMSAPAFSPSAHAPAPGNPLAAR